MTCIFKSKSIEIKKILRITLIFDINKINFRKSGFFILIIYNDSK